MMVESMESGHAISSVSPLAYFVNGIRYFALGRDFAAMETPYKYTGTDIGISFVVLLLFSLLAFAFAWQSFRAVKKK